MNSFEHKLFLILSFPLQTCEAVKAVVNCSRYVRRGTSWCSLSQFLRTDPGRVKPWWKSSNMKVDPEALVSCLGLEGWDNIDLMLSTCKKTRTLTTVRYLSTELLSAPHPVEPPPADKVRSIRTPRFISTRFNKNTFTFSSLKELVFLLADGFRSVRHPAPLSGLWTLDCSRCKFGLPGSRAASEAEAGPQDLLENCSEFRQQRLDLSDVETDQKENSDFVLTSIMKTQR